MKTAVISIILVILAFLGFKLIDSYTPVQYAPGVIIGIEHTGVTEIGDSDTPESFTVEIDILGIGISTYSVSDYPPNHFEVEQYIGIGYSIGRWTKTIYIKDLIAVELLLEGI